MRNAALLKRILFFALMEKPSMKMSLEFSQATLCSSAMAGWVHEKLATLAPLNSSSWRRASAWKDKQQQQQWEWRRREEKSKNKMNKKTMKRKKTKRRALWQFSPRMVFSQSQLSRSFYSTNLQIHLLLFLQYHLHFQRCWTLRELNSIEFLPAIQ
mgnify:CR=1 FL=1